MANLYLILVLLVFCSFIAVLMGVSIHDALKRH